MAAIKVLADLKFRFERRLFPRSSRQQLAREVNQRIYNNSLVILRRAIWLEACSK